MLEFLFVAMPAGLGSQRVSLFAFYDVRPSLGEKRTFPEPLQELLRIWRRRRSNPR